METNRIQSLDNDEIEIDLKELFFVLLRRAWIIILVGMIFAGASGIFTKTMITPKYESTSMLFILTKTTSITSLADIQMGTQLTKDYTVLIKSRPVIETVIDNLQLDLEYEELLDMLTIENPSDTRIIYLRIMHEDPEMAKKIVDEIAEVSADRIAGIMKTDEPSIAEFGNVAEEPSSPSTLKNVLVAGILGVFLAAFVVVVLYLLDDTIKTTDDMEKYLGITSLGAIPLEHKKKKQKKLRMFLGK